MNFYYVEYQTWHGNFYIGSKSGEMITDKELTDTTDNLTWENLADYYFNNGMACDFNIWWGDKKGGRVVSFFDAELFKPQTWDIKEKSGKPLDITIKTHYIKAKVSIDKILNWHDGEAAIQYLVERGLSVTRT